MPRANLIHIACLILFFPSISHCQVDTVGSGRALRFDGIDDYIDLGNVYDDLNFPFTISAWIFIDPSRTSAGGIFDSQNTLDTRYNGFWLAASPTAIAIEYGDGEGTNNPAFRRGKAAVGLNIAGRWNYVSAVIKGVSDIDIFLNGYNIGGSLAGNSSLPMDSSFPNDDAHIGSHFINGIHYYFKGMLDELRIFDRALSEVEIRQQMCRSLAGNEEGLIGYWTFDETTGNILKDRSENGFDGILMGNPTRVFSGAPIGDESVFLYTSSWSGAMLVEGDVAVGDVSGNPFGIHIYKINDTPSQTAGLGTESISKPYYGVFVADRKSGNTFTIQIEDACGIYYRNDNSQASWASSDQLNDIQDRREVVLIESSEHLEVSLGDDQIVCDKTSHLISANITDTTGKTFLWNTGESSQSISATQSGLYSVTVTDGCLVAKDSVFISFKKIPPAFSLGEDELSCEFTEKSLQPVIEDGFEWTWSDGSSGKSLTVRDYGIYWLKIENDCGSSVDSITFSKTEFEPHLIPNCITPNGDVRNQYFVLPSSGLSYSITIFNRWGKRVYQSDEYKNTWDATGLASGIYYYILNTKCITDLKGTIHVLR